MARLMVVEGDAPIDGHLGSSPRAHGHKMVWQHTGRGAIQEADTGEFDLPGRLAAEPGVLVSRTTLMAEVWDAHWCGSTKTLDVHVAALRRTMSILPGAADAALR
jgi:DNA-binding response OmpR family regulator